MPDPPVATAAAPNAPRSRPPTSDATRYLCAAVQLDSALAERLISGIVNEQHKAAPYSPGVDLALVLRHALAARSRQLIRDFALTLDLIALLYALISTSGLTFLLCLVLAWAVIVIERLYATFGVAARRLGPGRRGTELPAPQVSPWAEQRLRDISEAASGNVTVYGAFSPFVGSGVELSAWSFALDVSKPAAGKSVTKFHVTEIHDQVRSALSQLDVASVASFDIADRLYVDGRDLLGDNRFLNHDRTVPVSHVDPSLLRTLLTVPEDRARPYLCITLSGWRGQLVSSSFLRLMMTGDNLFVELSHSVLTPVLEVYQEVDRLLPQPTGRQIRQACTRSLRALPGRLLRAPLAVSRGVLTPMSREARRVRQRREITSNLRFNYGATISPREEAADPRYQRYFQQLDSDLFLKVIEKQILQAITEFLANKGVDLAELAERQSMVLNAGIYLAEGATFNGGAVAVGVGARAKAAATKAVATPSGG